jgi:hypothetical protein
MKRFHIHVGVKDLGQSIEFYSNLFGERPTKIKVDYAKWMLENPRINFAISTRTGKKGVDHLGIQVDDKSELCVLNEKLKESDLNLYDEGSSTCCYAHSTKAFINDPAGIPWEVFHTMADAEIFSDMAEKITKNESACCAPNKISSHGRC